MLNFTHDTCEIRNWLVGRRISIYIRTFAVRRAAGALKFLQEGLLLPASRQRQQGELGISSPLDPRGQRGCEPETVSSRSLSGSARARTRVGIMS